MDDAYKKLWSAVLQQALRDAQGNYYSYREEARKWFLSENYEPASFLWICDVLGLEPDSFRNAHRQECNGRGYSKAAKSDQRPNFWRSSAPNRRFGDPVVA